MVYNRPRYGSPYADRRMRPVSRSKPLRWNSPADAGDLLASHFGRALSVEYKDKAQQDPVTAADKETQAYLVDQYLSPVPRPRRILGEEDDASAGWRAVCRRFPVGARSPGRDHQLHERPARVRFFNRCVVPGPSVGRSRVHSLAFCQCVRRCRSLPCRRRSLRRRRARLGVPGRKTPGRSSHRSARVLWRVYTSWQGAEGPAAGPATGHRQHRIRACHDRPGRDAVCRHRGPAHVGHAGWRRGRTGSRRDRDDPVVGAQAVASL